jgi:hypothetical protein
MTVGGAAVIAPRGFFKAVIADIARDREIKISPRRHGDAENSGKLKRRN